MTDKEIQQLLDNQVYAQEKARFEWRFVNLNSMLGNTWAIFYGLMGGRMTGKSYAVAEFMLRQSLKHKEEVKNYWLRISETSTRQLLDNNGAKLIDPDLVRAYKVKPRSTLDTVWNGKDKLMTVLPLSRFAKQKGVAEYDKDFTGWYNIALDEFQVEIGEKRPYYDVLYNFIGTCENIARTTKQKIRVFLIGNTLEEASVILKAFNFIPEKVGRFYCRSKKLVIDNYPLTRAYLEDRKGSIADILGGGKMSNFTNQIEMDKTLIKKSILRHPSRIIKFYKPRDHWFTVWEDNIIRRYNGEGCLTRISMRPNIDEVFNTESRDAILSMYDARALSFHSLIDQAYFNDEMRRVRDSR